MRDPVSRLPDRDAHRDRDLGSGPARRAWRGRLTVGALVTVLLAGACTEDGGAPPSQSSGHRPRATATATPSPTPAPTPPPAAGFVAFGDSGGGEGQLDVARAMERWAAGHRVDALVTVGDNVYERGEPAHFDAQLKAPYVTLRANGRPLWVTLGNHDVDAGHAKRQLRYLGLPALPYTQELPGVQFLFLDSNRVDGAQTQWLERTLGAPGPPLRVVVFHHPAWSCGYHGPTEDVVARWVPIIEAHRVALVLSGHDHHYERFVSPAGVNYVVTGGGGQDLYPIAPKDFCDDVPRERADQQVGAVEHSFVGVEARPGELVLTAVAADDTVLDSTVVRR